MLSCGFWEFSEHFFCKTFANDCFYYFMSYFWILRISISGFANFRNMTNRSGEFSFLRYINIKNIEFSYLHFHNTYDHQFWTVGTYRQVDSLKQLLKRHHLLIMYYDKLLQLSFNMSYGHQFWTSKSAIDTK